nr:uncharacterized protein LOC120974477 [Aegilops tauschii subsp. strangulata]
MAAAGWLIVVCSGGSLALDVAALVFAILVEDCVPGVIQFTLEDPHQRLRMLLLLKAVPVGALLLLAESCWLKYERQLLPAAAAADSAGRCRAPGRPDRVRVAARVCRRRSGVVRAHRGPRRHARVRVVPARRRRDGMCRRGSRCGVGCRAALGPLVPAAPWPGASAGSSGQAYLLPWSPTVSACFMSALF